MYRLPNQFTPSASQIQSAAGGGSTTTTCSCCVVTAAGASILTAIHFSQLKKDRTTTASIAADTAPSGFSKDSRPPEMQAGGRTMLGLFSLVIAVGAGAVFASVGGFALGLTLGIGAFVAIFALAYESAGLSPRAGIVAGIAAVLVITLSTVIEFFLWNGS